MNQELWKTDDKAWMAQRKEEWRKVKENLNKMDVKVPRRGHKYHKELFFYGVMNPIFSDSRQVVMNNLVNTFAGCPLFFKMWYYPEDSEEALMKLFYQEGSRDLHRTLVDLLFRAFSASDFTSDYGMLGGREELFVKVLMPGLDWKEKRSFADPEEQYSASIRPGLVARYCTSDSAVMLYGAACNPYAPGQYLWDHFAYACEHYPELAIKDSFRDERVREVVQMILDFEVREEAPRDRPAAVNLRNQLYERFEQGDFPEMLMKYWREEKAKFEAEHSG